MVARRAAFVAALLAVLLFVCDRAPVAAQPYAEAYVNGLRAILDERWVDAVRFMRTAADARADTGDPIRFDNRTEPYVPFYYLGLSLFRTGDFSGAVVAFNRAEQLGAVSKGGNYLRLLRQMREESQQKISAVSRAPQGGRAGAVPQPTSPVAGRAAASAPPPPRRPAETAATPNAAVATPPPAVSSAFASAEQAIQRAMRESDAVERIGDLEALRTIDGNLARTTSAARTLLTDANAKLESARRGNANDGPQAESLAKRAQAEYEDARGQANNAVARITGELVQATNLFFWGQYASARTALEQLNYPASKFAAQVRLFRAAAAYSLFVTGGQRDDTLRREAEANVRDTRRMQSTLTPDPRMFSPRFVQFFGGVR